MEGDGRYRPRIVYGEDYTAMQAAIAEAIAARPTTIVPLSPAEEQIRRQRPRPTALYKAPYVPRPRDGKCIEETMGEHRFPSTATALQPRPPTIGKRPMRVIQLQPNGMRRDFERKSKSREESLGENLNPSSSAAATAIGSNVEVIRHSLLNMDLGKSSEEAAI